MIKALVVTLIGLTLFACSLTGMFENKVRVLIVDGQNNHAVWPMSTRMMKDYLNSTGQFEVEVYRTQYTWMGEKHLAQNPANDGRVHKDFPQPKHDASFSPTFSDYDVVISNFGWRAAAWPKHTEKAFEQYMKQGGGFVTVHAANNAFPHWPEYNKMIGLGGWGGRTEKDGPYIYFNDAGELQRDMSPGQGGGHGVQHQFEIHIRNSEHPITSKLNTHWLHSKDELYNRLRGPAQHLTVLATAFDDKKHNGSGRHEPVFMTIDYHKGRVFHTTLGHDLPAFKDQTFMSILASGTRWAAGLE